MMRAAPGASMARRVIATGALAWLCVLPGRAHAQAEEGPSPEERAEAEAHYTAAVDLFNSGRYREALEEFDAAIARAPEPIFYCNRAVVLAAIESYDESLDDLRTCRETYATSAEEAGQLDGQIRGFELLLSARRHATTMASLPMTDATQGSAPDPEATTPEAPLDPAARPGRGKRVFGVTSLVLGGAMVAGALTLDQLSGDLRRAYIEESQGGDQARYDELRGQLERRQLAFYGLLGAGALLGVTGAAMTLWGTAQGAPQDRRAQLVPQLGPGGAGATLRWSF